MRLLSFETSAKAASVALTLDGRLLGEQYQNSGLTHSQTLLVMAQQLLEQCGVKPQDLDAVAVASGPGSFTGVRIGVAAAKGFAWGAEKPLYGVSTLEAMARGLGIYEGFVCPVMDARRSQVYNAIFACHQGTLQRLCPDRAISLEELGQALSKLDGPIYLVGDGSLLCHDRLAQLPLILPPEHRMHQRAVGVALAAMEQVRQGLPGNAAELTPNYLRLSQAERERLEKEKLL